VRICGLLSLRFAELFFGLAAPAKRCAGLSAEAAVAGAVDKNAGADLKAVFSGLAQGRGAGDKAVFYYGPINGGIEQQRDVFFAATFFVENEIEHAGRALGVAHTGL
jgi:hypothetical protein